MGGNLQQARSTKFSSQEKGHSSGKHDDNRDKGPGRDRSKKKVPINTFCEKLLDTMPKGARRTGESRVMARKRHRSSTENAREKHAARSQLSKEGGQSLSEGDRDGGESSKSGSPTAEHQDLKQPLRLEQTVSQRKEREPRVGGFPDCAQGEKALVSVL